MKPHLLLASMLLISSPALADVNVSELKAFETAQGMKTGAVLLSIKNSGTEDDKLISVSSDVALVNEIHEMVDNNGIMKMIKVDAVDVKSGETVTFTPHGYHVMLIDLKSPLKSGEKFPLTLEFAKSGKITKDVEILSRAVQSRTTATHRDTSHHGHH